MDGPLLVPLAPGAVIRSAGRNWRITRDLTADTVLAEDLATGAAGRIRIDDIEAARPGAPAAAADETPVPGAAPGALEAIPQEAWAIAQARFQTIDPLLNRRFRNRADVATAAAEANVSSATIYDWISRFERSGHVSSLLPQARGRRAGVKQLSPEMEQIVQHFVESEYLHKQQKVAQDVIEAVRSYCEAQNLKPPGDRTIQRRIAELDEAYRLRRRGRRDEARKYEPRPGHYPATTHPMEVVQIDHTPADYEVVTDDRLHVLGRPWITLAIDVHTRMVVGYRLGMERPDAHAVGLCVCMAILPKTDVLAALEMPGEWPVRGKPGKIFCDNAGEFDSATVQRACDEHRIDLEFRPVGKPEYGGHIERLCQTVNKRIHKLPGTTFSNPSERGGYSSSKEAVLTLDEFERWLVNFIVNHYHTRVHSGIRMPPVAKWNDGIRGTKTTAGRGLPIHVSDPERLRLDFMPYRELSVQQYGLQWDHMRYWTSALNRWINSKEPDSGQRRKFIVRRDPRRIDQLWFQDPETKEYMPVGYADKSMPVMSVWEQRAAVRQAKASGVARVDQHAIKQGHELAQRILDESKAQTKSARRAERRRVDRERAMGQTLADTHVLRTPRPGPDPSEPYQPGLGIDIDAMDVPMPELIDISAYD